MELEENKNKDKSTTIDEDPTKNDVDRKAKLTNMLTINKNKRQPTINQNKEKLNAELQKKHEHLTKQQNTRIMRKQLTNKKLHKSTYEKSNRLRSLIWKFLESCHTAGRIPVHICGPFIASKLCTSYNIGRFYGNGA